MPKASPIQTSFNAGELAPEVDGRVDIGKYVSACSRMENFFPLVQGPARRRGGTKFVAAVKNSNHRTWLAKFEFNTEQAYVLEFGDEYVRFFTDNGVLVYPSADAWVTSTVYSVGDLITNGGNTYYCVTAHTAGATFAGDSAYWYQMPVTGEYQIPAPWAVEDLINTDGTFALDMVQSGDILYIVNSNYAPRKLSRLGATTWTITEFTPDGGPFDSYDPDETITVYASAQTGSVNLVASGSIFTAQDVGRLFFLEQKKANAISSWQTGASITANDLRRYDGKTYKALNSATTGSIPPSHTVGAEYDGNPGVQWEYQDPGYGWAQITSFTSATQVAATVISLLPDQTVTSGNATTRWAFGSWGSVPGYPSHVTFFRNRLVFARAIDRALWFSVAGDYEVFRDRDRGGNVTASSSITMSVESDQSNKIQFLVPAQALIIGTAGGEYACSEQTDSEPFGPGNTKIVESSQFGSRGAKPVRVGESILFVQRSGRKLREVSYDALQFDYKSLDMSVLAPHMIPKGRSIVQLTYQKEPHSIVWIARDDGLLVGFTFNREQYTDPPFGGWHRHMLGGHGVVESIVSVPSPNNDRDDLWLIVRRTINGATTRYIEYMQPEYESGDAQEDSFYVDSGLTYIGAATDTLSGFDHLEGETLDVLADGAAHPQVVVSSGTIELQRLSSVVHAGLPCPAKLATMRINAGSADGTAQGKTKRITDVSVRLLETLGGEMGPSDGELDELLFRSAADPMDNAPPLFTGDKTIQWPGGYETDGYIWYVNNQPMPVTIVALMPKVNTQD
jgi:hypothetical protein